MDEFLNLLVELFDEKNGNFSEGQTADARALAGLQPQLYNSLFGAFKSVPFASDQRGVADPVGFAAAVMEWGREILTKSPATAGSKGKKARVVSNLPVITDATTHRLIDFLKITDGLQRTPQTAQLLGAIFAAALVVEVGNKARVIQAISDEINGPQGPMVYRAIAEYITAKRLSGREEKFHLNLQHEIATAAGSIANYRAEYESERDVRRSEMGALASSASELSGHVDKVSLAIEESRNRLVNFETTMREEMKLDRARLTWKSRYEEARNGFKIAISLLIIFMVTTFYAAINWGFPIITKLAEIEKVTGGSGDNIAVALTHQFGRLVVFSVPIFVFLWMLRVVMRYFMRSMLLMDDARQRQTMLDTYFMLSENGRADDRDRPLVLWALFRNTPGHGPDGIEPPDFTEVINAGMNRQ
jgi:hypothetical protein